MKNAFRLAIALLATMPLTQTTARAQELTPREEADEMEGDLGFGYVARDGGVALSQDTSAVFCAIPAVLVVDRSDEADVQRLLGAKDLGDGRWEVPDPDTGNLVMASVQYASYAYSENADDADPGDDAVALPRVPKGSVTIAPNPWACRRILRGYICGTPSNCGNGACRFGHRITQVRRFLTCRYTGNRQDRCLEFVAPVCKLTRYTCRDCTGPILGTWPIRRWVCAVF